MNKDGFIIILLLYRKKTFKTRFFIHTRASIMPPRRPPPPPPPSKRRSAPAGEPPTKRPKSTAAPPPPPPPPSQRQKPMTTHDAANNKWKQMQRMRFKHKDAKKKTKVTVQSSRQPPDRLRKAISDQQDLVSKSITYEKRSMIGALKYMPHAIYKLMENMPNPWESYRDVNVIYHTNGVITFINETPRVIEPVYKAQWSSTWSSMRREKRDRKHFKRVNLPVFDDDEPFVNYVNQLSSLNTNEAIAIQLPSSEDDEWFRESRPLSDTEYVNGESYKNYNLTTNTLMKLYQISEPLIDRVIDKNYYYLFDYQSFLIAKALNLSIPSGPKFEPLYPEDLKIVDDLNEFNDIDTIIFRKQIRSEYKIAFPFLYNSNCKSVQPTIYHHHSVLFNEDSRLFEINYDYNLIPPQQNKDQNMDYDEDDDDDDFSLPDTLKPFLENENLKADNDNEALSLYWAPRPFNSKSGKTIRAQDVALIKDWFSQPSSVNDRVKVKSSYKKLLKGSILNKLNDKKIPNDSSHASLLKVLKKTKFFKETKIDWLEAGLQICQQGYNMLNLLLHKRGLTYLHLDFNFNLKPIRTLSTKERKKSRFGNAFHLIRELLRVVKLVIDLHIEFRLGNIDSYQLADGIHYTFNHLGHLTGIYRYKYKVMRQIRKCKDLKHLIYNKFNETIGKGPGCGFWQPSWIVWLNFIRGVIPLLERWLGNLVSRQFEGRQQSKEIAKTLTKQRIDSYYDLELRASVMKDILDMIPEGVRQEKSKTILQHLSEAWRCWKANVPWVVPGLPKPIENIIQRYIKAKSEGWISVAHYNREKINSGSHVEKAIVKKNLGRMTRLWVKNEQSRQLDYQKSGPYITTEDGVEMYMNMSKWLELRKFVSIPFPPINYKHDTKILILALENLKEIYLGNQRLNAQEREELSLIEQAYDNPHEFLAQIKKFVLTQRNFKEVKIEMFDHYTNLTPIYAIEPFEKIVDAYLDQYLWYEADKRGLFPNWVKPNDSEISPLLAYKFCQGLNNLDDVWDYEDDQCNVLLQTNLDKLSEKIDFTVLNHLLKLVVDPNIADYITAKNNVNLNYKDMNHINQYGLIRGLKFASFVYQYYGLIIDLMILGLDRAEEIAGPCDSPNEFLEFENVETQTSSPVRLYMRYLDKVTIFFRFEKYQSDELIEDFLTENPDPNFENIIGYNNRRCWPKDSRMRLTKHDVQLGKACFWEIQSRVPESVVELKWENTLASVYSKDNANLLLTICGFDIRILPTLRSFGTEKSTKDGVWELVNENSKECTAKAYLQVSDEDIQKFHNRIKQILLSAGSSPFVKIASRWNTAVLSLFVYYREAIVNTELLLDILVKSETKIQNKIKMGLNSKMPTRFPPVVFYTPKELGGLGMLSASHILIPASDLRWSKQTDTGITHFRAGMTDDDEKLIPTIFRYITTWENEFLDSQRVWSEFSIKRAEAEQLKKKLTFEDLKECWDRGLPRISTLFQKDRQTLAIDKGYRIRQEFAQFSNMRKSPFWWLSDKHDGKLWNLSAYRADVIQALGGVETILEHTLFKATGFESWEGLFWEKASGFEDTMKFKKLTNAQRSGLSQIPNRRFTLWWSPTINRANVYVGFLVQLDLTGVFLHGKIPTLKISLIQTFRAHLWQKIHESLVVDLCQVFDNHLNELQIDEIQKLPIHPRKSYKMNASTADILMTSGAQWPCSKPSLLFDSNDIFTAIKSDKFWVDVQIRYGDYDSHDISRYARAKFLDYTTDHTSIYPSSTGLMIVIDLAYNMYDAYGNWFPGLKELVQKAMKTIMRANPAVYVFRERVRKGLQLYQAQTQEAFLSSSNYAELFNNDNKIFVDDVNVYRVVTHGTSEGNSAVKVLNGVLFMLNPRTGQLFLKIIHSSFFQGKSKRSQLAKWKSAEEVAALVRSLPKEDQPQQIIVTRKGLLDPLEVHMLDFPNISLRPTELHLPFETILKNDKLLNLINTSKESQMALFNIYDDWTTSCSSFTAFNRLIVLLRSLQINSEKTKMIIKPDSSIEIQENHLWPSLSDDQWRTVEGQLADMILNDYTEKHDINVNTLTDNEIRDIILGQDIRALSVRRQKINEIEGQKTVTMGNDEEAEHQVAIKTKTVNVHGEEIVTVTTTNHEQERFESKSSWRNRALTSSMLQMRIDKIYAESGDFANLESNAYVIPKNLLKRFIMCSDSRTQIGGYIFGKSPDDGNDQVKEVRALMMVPQIGDNHHIEFPNALPKLGSNLDDLEPLGWIHTNTIGFDNDLDSAVEIITHSKYVKNHHWDLKSSILSVKFTPGSLTLESSRVSVNGLNWGDKYQDFKSGQQFNGFSNDYKIKNPLIITDKFNGLFLVPGNDLWNYSFISNSFREDMDFDVKIDDPLPFYHEMHRPIHFDNFNNLEGDDELEYNQIDLLS